MRKQRFFVTVLVSALVTVLVACGNSIIPETSEVGAKDIVETIEVETEVSEAPQIEVEKISTTIEPEETKTKVSEESKELSIGVVAGEAKKSSLKTTEVIKATPVVADEDLPLLSDNGLYIIPGAISENQTPVIQADPNAGQVSSSSSHHHHHDDEDDNEEETEEAAIVVYDWLGHSYEATEDTLEEVLLGIYSKAENYLFPIEWAGNMPTRGFAIEYSPIGTRDLNILIAVVQTKDGDDYAFEAADKAVRKVYKKKSRDEMVEYFEVNVDPGPAIEQEPDKKVSPKETAEEPTKDIEEKSDDDSAIEKPHTWSGIDAI